MATTQKWIGHDLAGFDSKVSHPWRVVEVVVVAGRWGWWIVESGEWRDEVWCGARRFLLHVDPSEVIGDEADMYQSLNWLRTNPKWGMVGADSWIWWRIE